MQAMLKCCCTQIHSGHTLIVRFAESCARMHMGKAFSIVRHTPKAAGILNAAASCLGEATLSASSKHPCCSQFHCTQDVTA